MEKELVMSHTEQQPLAVVVAWLDAMRRGDLDAVGDVLDPDVVWRGVPADAICHDRDEVLDMLSEQLARGVPRASALELVSGEHAVVLGVRSDQLDQIGDYPLPGQLFNVFRLADGRIMEITDYAHRQQALDAAAAAPPPWV
jgi:ketosteroid isomerase-like protein